MTVKYFIPLLFIQFKVVFNKEKSGFYKHWIHFLNHSYSRSQVRLQYRIIWWQFRYQRINFFNITYLYRLL